MWGYNDSRRSDERGASAVEFALVLPVLVTILLGTVSAGLAYTHAVGLTNAVREGARFGATADASSSSWADDVITRVRQTQFDDSTVSSSSTTAVCVQLWKQGTGQVKLSCDQGDGSVSPTLAVSSAPAVPTGLPTSACVVRVWAARPFKITVVVAPVLKGTSQPGSVARYEKPTC